MKSGLYEKYYLNFISPISRHLLEDLASSALQYECVDVVTKVIPSAGVGYHFVALLLVLSI